MPEQLTAISLWIVAGAAINGIPFNDEDANLRAALKAMAAAGKGEE